MFRLSSFGLAMAIAASVAAQQVAVDLSGYDAKCPIQVSQQDSGLSARWKTRDGWETAVTFSLERGAPLFAKLEADGKVLASNVDPQFVVTTGSRRKQPGNRYIFFDNPATRAKERHVAKMELKHVKVKSFGNRVSIIFDEISAGPFEGDLLIHLYDGSPLVHVEAAMRNQREDLAYIYDSILMGEFSTIAWKDLDNNVPRRKPVGEMTALAVRLRTIMAEQAGGTIAVFPAPHAWFFPRDYTNNLKFAQMGAAGFGLRQDPSGGGAFVPWFDAPAGKTQRMDFFMLLNSGATEGTLARVAEYTRGDRFKEVAGHLTFTSHYHSRLTVAEMAGKKEVTPEFVRIMKGMNVNLVHLAEFHGDGNPDDPGPRRLPQMKAMFEMCRKYSDAQLLLMPGEEGSKYLGVSVPREHPGHWMYFFPRPVYLTFVRGKEQPFVEEIEGYGRVYHVGSTADMVKLLEEEKGLAWTTHPRIKASYRTPDAFKDEEWYKSAIWLGAAWKAMPGDLSEDRLGRRCLDLLDDMNQWGQRKYLPAEVDVFEIDRTHELWGHMNINYLKMEKMPKWDDWSEVLDVLRRGEFWCTTGEVLIQKFEVRKDGVEAVVEGTFPLDFAEVIWGTNKGVHRERIEIRSGEFSEGVKVSSKTNLSEANWVRLEVWDIARNGAYTQPITP